MSKKIISPAQALVLLERIQKENPVRKQAAYNTVAESAAVWAQQALNRDRDLLRELEAINQHIGRTSTFGAPAGAAPAPQQAAPAVPTAEQPTQDVAVEGAPPEAVGGGGEAPSFDHIPEEQRQAAIEKYMDAATSGLEPNANAPAPPAAATPPAKRAAAAKAAKPVSTDAKA